MTIIICPRCNMRITVGFDVTDFVHDCSQSDKSNVIKQDDVIITGDWEDFSGSGTRSAQEVILAGLENEFQGTRAGIEGERKHELTARGKTATTHRQRKHLEFINLKKTLII